MASTGVSHGGPARAHREAATGHATAHGGQVVRKFHFWRHFVEMVIAMVAGMALLGFPFRAILGSFRIHAGRGVPSVPGDRLPRHDVQHGRRDGRVDAASRHPWRMTVEMTLAMCVATTVALGMFWLHIIAADPMIALMHVLMLPAMLAVMLRRREEYAHAYR